MGIWASSRAIFVGIVLLALISVLAACGSGEDATSPAGSSGAGTPTSEVSLFEELLGTIPDTPDTRKSVMINDYAAVRKILELSPTSPDAEFPALLQHFIDSIGSNNTGIKTYLARGPFISGMDDRFMENKKKVYLAFDGRNVDQSVEAGIVPFVLEVVRGRFDPTATAEALAACSECPPADLESHNDVPFYSWGGDGQGKLRDRRNPPAFDHLGRGGRIAVSNEYVYRTVETPGMRALIDSGNGEVQTLAGVEEFRLLVQAMSGLGVYSAFFSNQTYKVGSNDTPDNPSIYFSFPAVLENLKKEIGKSTLPLPYVAFSTGVGHDDTGPYMALALVHGDAESAEQNQTRLAQRIEENPELQIWKDSLGETTFSVEGRVLSAVMRGEGPASSWKSLAFLWMPVPLIPHE